MNTNDLRYIILKNATIQLEKEFEHICFQYSVKLKKPIIIIENLADSFGKWDVNRNVIFISESLIFKYSWNKVICVLKHEMAHQIVSQIFKSNDIHQDDFIRAGQWLGLEPCYLKASLSLTEDFPDWRNNQGSEEELKIFRKVEKLLSLSESSNEHEAFLAMEKVRELYKKYNVERFINNIDMNNVSLTIDLKFRKIPSNIFLISNILQDHFFVSNIFSKLYIPNLNREHRCLIIMGEKHNVLMAEHVYEFLLQKIEFLWKNYQRENTLIFKFKASYQKGLVEGFKTKLESLKNNAVQNCASQEHALVKQYKSKLNSYVKTQFPKTTGIQQSGMVYKDHYEKGTIEGHRIHISKPISSEQKSASGIKLLGTGK